MHIDDAVGFSLSEDGVNTFLKIAHCKSRKRRTDFAVAVAVAAAVQRVSTSRRAAGAVEVDAVGFDGERRNRLFK